VDALKLLMTREITHMKAFGVALETMGKGPLEIGEMPVEDKWVNQFYNDSNGPGELGDDAKGPSNEGDGWDSVDSPAYAEYGMPK
jgi:Mn-containing catalase